MMYDIARTSNSHSLSHIESGSSCSGTLYGILYSFMGYRFMYGASSPLADLNNAAPVKQEPIYSKESQLSNSAIGSERTVHVIDSVGHGRIDGTFWLFLRIESDDALALTPHGENVTHGKQWPRIPSRLRRVACETCGTCHGMWYDTCTREPDASSTARVHPSNSNQTSTALLKKHGSYLRDAPQQPALGKHLRADLQKTGQAALLSWEASSVGPANELLWTVKCKLRGEIKGEASSRSKHEAKEMAARRALESLGAALP
ncbi:uncharacterized protein LAESUDRAFT_748720 [Laetiporus sulphureus 93-53]|uniref:DRBM domain-containing protein n=1 Tax=Laetiporus sulphureus 93-53 TaxID=1314785 RepID=A0A165F958_9APHY|nr:uncharacterized protein LAESUDRAFT_748720 [Laetiporus sulphureus 93-53]KZT08621.1 hypothetical protein LAESUDRAFT_748720 [Laetiporus sulphureus 93-53]